jgi:hypothetical protein
VLIQTLPRAPRKKVLHGQSSPRGAFRDTTRTFLVVWIAGAVLLLSMTMSDDTLMDAPSTLMTSIGGNFATSAADTGSRCLSAFEVETALLSTTA